MSSEAVCLYFYECCSSVSVFLAFLFSPLFQGYFPSRAIPTILVPGPQQFIVYGVLRTVHSIQCTVYSIQCTVYIGLCTVYSVSFQVKI